MENYERKLVPDLLRWVRQESAGQRTVIVRIAYSQDPEDAAETVGRQGMAVQSNGPGVLIASTDSESMKKVAELSWVVSIDVPKRLDMKHELGKF